MLSTPTGSARPPVVREVGSVPLPSAYGAFVAHAFTFPSGNTHVALVTGRVDAEPPPLTRLHSECLTGDVLASLRCDCGVQLRAALRDVAACGQGIVLYLGGHEGRGIGLIDKLRAYLEQDGGADTVDANLRLGLPVDSRDYSEAAAVLDRLGVSRVRLLTNNPAKVAGLRGQGITVCETVGLTTAGQTHNRGYLAAKQLRLGHRQPAGLPLAPARLPAVDVAQLLGPVREHPGRPHVVVKYAQTLDGRIAATGGDSKWISGEAERRVAHTLRAACDAVLVGAGTGCADDPQLTVRMVDGASPTRAVLDSALRVPATARIFDEEAPSVALTRTGVDPDRVRRLEERGVCVRQLPASTDGVDLGAALAELGALGVRALLVEGGARVITSLLAGRFVDRLIVSVTPRILGAGVDAVGPLGTTRVADSITLRAPQTFQAGDDLLVAGDLN